MKRRVFAASVIMIFLSGFVLSGQGSEPEKLTGVRVTHETDTAARVVIDTTGEVKSHLFHVSNPPRLVVEMPEVDHDNPDKEIQVDGNILKRVRSGQYADNPVKISRVVLDMAAGEYYYEEDRSSEKITVYAGVTREAVDSLRGNITDSPQETVSKNPGIKPNVPTQEHEEKVEEVLRQKKEREKKRKEVLSDMDEEMKEKISRVMETTPGSLVGPLSNEPVDFNYRNADITKILRTFALKLDKNIIPAPGVEGEVSLRLRQVPFDEAFRILLDRAELVAIQKTRNVIEVVQKDKMPTERKTFNLQTRKAGAVKETLDALMTAEEELHTNITVDEASNSLIVSATPSVLQKMEALVKQLDIKSPQIKIKARLIEVQDSDMLETGISWAATVPFDDCEVERVRAVKDMRNFEIGDPDSPDFDGRVETERAITRVPGAGGLLDISAVLDETSLYALLNFIEEKTVSKTVSEPTILTENNKSAQIHVGRNLPIRTTRADDVGYTETVEFIQEGVDLRVTPVVSPGSSQIALDVNVGVSGFEEFRADSPVTMERSAQTEVTVESGKTIVIGGLIQEEVSETQAGIPVLMDIPILGYLFKSHTGRTESSELLIFLTPEILSD